jgi:hypothetical protein
MPHDRDLFHRAAGKVTGLCYPDKSAHAISCLPVNTFFGIFVVSQPDIKKSD